MNSSLPPDEPRVIVGVDDSQSARWALAWALGESRLRGMPLLIVHVTPVPPYAAPAGIPGQAAIGGLRDAGAELIATLLQEVCGRPDQRVSALTLVGAPGDALVRLAREEDILVVGRGGRHPLSRLLRPSVRRHCAQHARATLVCVPAPRAEELTVPGAEAERSRHWPWGERRRPAE